MNTFDKLRHLLEECGIEYLEKQIINGVEFLFDWSDQCGGYTKRIGVKGACCYAELDHIDPAKAIEVTLGKGCEAMTDNLKPCPWCWAVPEIKQHNGVYAVQCTNGNCQIQPATFFMRTAEEAVEAWNHLDDAPDVEWLIDENKQLKRLVSNIYSSLLEMATTPRVTT